MKTIKNSTERLPPFCPSCDKEGKVWTTVKREVEQIFRKEHYKVQAAVTECKHCGFRLVTDAQADAMVQQVADAFRRSHGLLTSREILARRHAMELSQIEFATWLGVGVASVKRWEQGLVQDRASDLLIQERTAHAMYGSDVYPLTQPQVESHVFVCVSGFKKLFVRSWEVAAETFKIQTSAHDTTSHFDEHAFTVTA